MSWQGLPASPLAPSHLGQAAPEGQEGLCRLVIHLQGGRRVLHRAPIARPWSPTNVSTDQRPGTGSNSLNTLSTAVGQQWLHFHSSEQPAARAEPLISGQDSKQARSKELMPFTRTCSAQMLNAQLHRAPSAGQVLPERHALRQTYAIGLNTLQSSGCRRQWLGSARLVAPITCRAATGSPAAPKRAAGRSGGARKAASGAPLLPWVSEGAGGEGGVEWGGRKSCGAGAPASLGRLCLFLSANGLLL